MSSCNNVSEWQVHSLLQVVVAGLRSNSRDVFALGAILAARVLPRVSLKARVANKILKVLKAASRRSDDGGADADTLALLLIVFRSQRRVVDLGRVLALLARHETVLKEEIFHPGRQDGGEFDPAFAAKVLSALATLCQEVAADPDPSQNVKCLMDCVGKALDPAVAVEPDYDSALTLIKSVSKAMLAYKTIRKSAKKQQEKGDAKKEICKAIVTACKRVLGLLKARYPAEYVQHSAVQTEDVDILFMGGDAEPTHAEIAAKRILLDDSMVSLASASFLPVVSRRDRDPQLRSAKRGSSRSIALLLSGESVQPGFVLRHLAGGDRAARLVCNLLAVYDRKAIVVGAVARFACSRDFGEDEDAARELGPGFDLELALLPFLILLETNWIRVLSDLKESWFVQNKSALLASTLEALPKETGKKEADFKKTSKALMASLAKATPTQELIRVVKKAASEPKHHDPTLFSLLLHLIMERIDAKSSESKATVTELAVSALDMLAIACSKMELREEDEEASDTTDIQKLLFTARANRQLATRLVIDMLRCLVRKKELLTTEAAVKTKLLALGCASKKKKLGAITEAALEAFDDLLGTGEVMERFALDVFTSDRSEGQGDVVLTPHMRVYCGKKLLNQVTSSKEARRRLLGLRSEAFPRILAAVDESNLKVAKLALSVLEAAVQSEEDQDRHQTYRPLAAFIVERREDVLASTSVNLPLAVGEFLEKKNGDACARALVNRTTSSEEEWATFVKLEPFLSSVRHPTEIVTLAELGMTALKKEGCDSVSSRVLEVLLRHFVPSFLQHMDRRPCKDFLLACVASSRSISYSNVMEMVAVVALRNLRGSPALPKDTLGLFSSLVRLSLKVEDGSVLTECRALIKELPVVTDMFVRILEQIWLEERKEKAATGTR